MVYVHVFYADFDVVHKWYLTHDVLERAEHLAKNVPAIRSIEITTDDRAAMWWWDRPAK